MVEYGLPVFNRWLSVLTSADIEDVLYILRSAVLHEIIRVGYDPFVKADESLLRKMVRAGLIRKTKGGYSVSEYGLLFLSMFSMLLAEVGLYEETPPSRRMLEMIERLIGFTQLYELSGLKADNVVVISNLLGRLAELTSLVPILRVEDVQRLVRRIAELRDALIEVGGEWRQEIAALDTVLNADLGVIDGNLGGFDMLFNRFMRVSVVPSAAVDAVIDAIAKGNISPWRMFSWGVLPVRVLPLAPVAVRYRQERGESKGVPATGGKRVVVMPSATELFGVLSSLVLKGVVPELDEDAWWLESLEHYRENYEKMKALKGYRRALKARKLMAVSMVFEGLGDEVDQSPRERLWKGFCRLANLV